MPLNVKSENCKINITDESDLSVSNESANFHIRPFINVTTPTSGQNVKVATNYPGLITWNITGTTVNFVDIKYDTDNGNNSYPDAIALHVPASQGSLDWNNVNNTPTAKAKIRVVDNASSVVYGDSAKFNIIGRLDVTQPIGGENWTAFANSSVIKWNATGVSILCDVWYSANSGTNWNYIKTVNINTDGPGQTFWDANFSYPVTNNGRIKINSTLDDNVNGSSAADFNLIASLDVINPENGTVWVSNNTYPINWTTLGG